MDLKTIQFGPAQINFYDSTLGYLFLGYIDPENYSLVQEPLIHELVDGEEFQWGNSTEFSCAIYNCSPEMWVDLFNKRAYKQDIYIIGVNYVIKLNDLYISTYQERELGAGGKSNIYITAKTKDESNVEIITNLLSSVKDGFDYGSCEIDTNSDGLCDGWINSGLTCTRYSTWKYSGTYSQRLEYDQSGLDYALLRVRFPIDKFEIRITVSAQVKNILGSTSRFDFGFRLLTAAESPSVVSTHTVNHSFNGSEEKQISHSAMVVPAVEVGWIEIIVQTVVAPYDDVDAAFDNLQIQVGSLTNYSEND